MSKKPSPQDKIAFERYQVYKKRLQAILKQKNPKKIGAVDALLSKYRGREHGVYAKVCSKYGITPKPEWKPNTKPLNKNKTNPPKAKSIKNQPKQIKNQKPLKKPITTQSKRKPSTQPQIRNKLSSLKHKRIVQKQNSIRKPIPPKKPSPPIPKPKQKIEESEDDYEDDFEDYSDDFEEQNEHKTTTQKTNPWIEKFNLKPSETKTLFTMHERTVHEQYLRKIGREICIRGVQSYGLQDMKTQTDKQKQESKATQYAFSDQIGNDWRYDRTRLLSFMRKSSKLMDGLLSYKNSEDHVKRLLSKNDGGSRPFLSEGISLVYNALLDRRSVNDITFCSSNESIICVAYSALNKEETEDEKIDQNATQMIRYRGLICVWDVRQPSYPLYQLICDDEVKVVEFHPNNDSLVIAGRQNGCIAAWDLTEINKMHQRCTVGKKTIYVRYPTYMTDCQWNKNHIYPVVALKSFKTNAFCSMDSSGVMIGWSVLQMSPPPPDELITAPIDFDLGCRDLDTIKMTQEFKFNMNANAYVSSTHSVYSSCCISIDPADRYGTRILVAFQASVYLVRRIGTSVEIIKEFTLKYDMAGIRHTHTNVISVALCPWAPTVFVAGYQNGMICVFDIDNCIPIRRLYDTHLTHGVIAVSWIKGSNASDKDMLLYAVFQNGIIRFIDVNKETQNYIFEKVLNKSKKSKNKPCCKSMNTFIALSNMMGNHSFSVHRICA
eukprot:53372_1